MTYSQNDNFKKQGISIHVWVLLTFSNWHGNIQDFGTLKLSMDINVDWGIYQKIVAGSWIMSSQNNVNHYKFDWTGCCYMSLALGDDVPNSSQKF